MSEAGDCLAAALQPLRHANIVRFHGACQSAASGNKSYDNIRQYVNCKSHTVLGRPTGSRGMSTHHDYPTNTAPCRDRQRQQSFLALAAYVAPSSPSHNSKSQSLCCPQCRCLPVRWEHAMQATPYADTMPFQISQRPKQATADNFQVSRMSQEVPTRQLYSTKRHHNALKSTRQNMSQ